MNLGPKKLMPPRDLKQCIVCARWFTLDRISTHEAICQKSSAVKRKSFDISQQGRRGIESERLKKQASTNECLDPPQENGPCGLSTNWRRKHEEFIKKIKEARENSSGKNQTVSDLPFPPPECDSTDYVQCQHCLRRFNQTSASRHIAICASRPKAH